MIKKYLMTMFIMMNVSFASSSTNKDVNLDEIKRFATVVAQIKQLYIEDKNYSKLFDDAIKGMMKGLDPHSDYVSPENVKDFKANSTGLYGGLGMEVEADMSGAVKVISAFDNSPAKRAGLKSGDLIVAINDTLLQNMDLNDSVKMMKGKPNTSVEITVVSEGEKEPKKLKLTREIIKFAEVKSKIIDDEVGYIRISTFNEKTFHQVVKAIQKIKSEGKGKLTGVIIDVRDNPGGLLDSVVQVSDLFLDAKQLSNKKIVSIKGRTGQEVIEYATNGDTLNGLPLAILINKGSASASEILAGSLKDHNRAIIIGTETFGKGSVQSVIPVDGKSFIKITTALYYTPNEVSIQANGIIPDVYVDITTLPKPETKNNVFKNLSEKNFLNHFKNNKKVDNKALINAEKNKIDLAHDDFQLYQAVRIIEGMSSIKS